MSQLCDPQSLATDSKCLAENFSRRELLAIRVVLLCNLLNGTTMNCDSETLAAASKCIMESMSQGDMEAAETYLLCQIVNGGGGGGGTNNLSGNGSPVGAFTPNYIGQAYTDLTTPGYWTSTGLTNASWLQVAMLMLCFMLGLISSQGDANAAGLTISTVNGYGTNTYLQNGTSSGMVITNPVFSLIEGNITLNDGSGVAGISADGSGDYSFLFPGNVTWYPMGSMGFEMQGGLLFYIDDGSGMSLTFEGDGSGNWQMNSSQDLSIQGNPLSFQGFSTFNSGVEIVQNLSLDSELLDGHGSGGTPGQILTSEGIDVAWANLLATNWSLPSGVNAAASATNSTRATWNVLISFTDAVGGSPAIKVQLPGLMTNYIHPVIAGVAGTVTNFYSFPIMGKTTNTIVDASGSGASTAVIASFLTQ